MNLSKLIVAASLAVMIAAPSHAAVIAVIDSGTDLNHKDLTNKRWYNPKDIDDAVDNDDNGYIDDVNGWNFAESNNKLFDKTLLGTFSSDCYKYFEVQTRLLKGTGSAEDLAWIKEAQANEKLMTELETFANFVHGSHVAGISSRNADKAQLMIIKLIPTKRPTIGPHQKMDELSQAFAGFAKAGASDAVIRQALKLLGAAQGKALAPIGKYVETEKARVANCSFGLSTKAAKGVLAPILKMLMRRDATPEELETYSIFFVNEVLKSQSILLTSKQTLFVIAAGNDGSNNDVYPASPTNMKQDNTISVAATLGYGKLASFSNYGEKMVEVAAPGVGIESTIPGNLYLTVSGTSQASPFVANLAGLILDENPALTNAEVKQILMGTVDLKDFLKGKVASGGIVNTNRSLMAAKLSRTLSVSESISSSRLQVNDVQENPTKWNTNGYEGFVMPLPTLFN